LRRGEGSRSLFQGGESIHIFVLGLAENLGGLRGTLKGWPVVRRNQDITMEGTHKKKVTEHTWSTRILRSGRSSQYFGRVKNRTGFHACEKQKRGGYPGARRSLRGEKRYMGTLDRGEDFFSVL